MAAEASMASRASLLRVTREWARATARTSPAATPLQPSAIGCPSLMSRDTSAWRGGGLGKMGRMSASARTTVAHVGAGGGSARISPAQARRIVIAAQGLGARPTGAVGARHLQRVVDRVGVVQIDSVNVLARAHLVTLFARLGP